MKGPRTNARRVPVPRRAGHVDFPHPALARVVYSRTHSQRHEAHVFQVSIQANAGPDTPASLAASAQMFAQAAPYEMIELPKRLAGITQAKIIGPASQVSIQAPNQFRQGCVTLLRINKVPQRLPLPRHRFARGLQVQIAPVSSSILVSVIPKGVAQEVQALAGLSQIQLASLLAINLQAQPSFQFSLNPVVQLWTDVTSQDDKVVGIAYQLRLDPLPWPIYLLKPVIEPVQVEVGQQRTEDASLRSPSVIAPHRRRFSV